jgi:hypothetical protein
MKFQFIAFQLLIGALYAQSQSSTPKMVQTYDDIKANQSYAMVVSEDAVCSGSIVGAVINWFTLTSVGPLNSKYQVMKINGRRQYVHTLTLILQSLILF